MVRHQQESRLRIETRRVSERYPNVLLPLVHDWVHTCAFFPCSLSRRISRTQRRAQFAIAYGHTLADSIAFLRSSTMERGRVRTSLLLMASRNVQESSRWSSSGKGCYWKCNAKYGGGMVKCSLRSVMCSWRDVDRCEKRHTRTIDSCDSTSCTRRPWGLYLNSANCFNTGIGRCQVALYSVTV